ncbi:uncharacterized protein EI90DRAFT_3048058 [Cantharellus anzutake]|uniref:uncharacterized protein n=1 Tax=Cantharellus anzutake TaxID=1750568 RepID=UPI0019061070|nr:uncharacterized protein EI90DRAFT_3048058 [Cantharellus anzutake]KAF8335361.1 hypothetical protein EI90DRAFT_3048058 [Cantharellus anzutake]
MRTNLSRHTCSFGDHAWPIKPIFPAVRDMHNYISSYSQSSLDPKSISLQHTVVGVERSDLRWKVSWKSERGGLERETFDYLIISSGFFSTKCIPEIPGLQSFPGVIMHSSDYREHSQVEGKRVAIVGDSFSAAELAGEIAPLTRRLTHIHPRPFYVFPRFLPLKSGQSASTFVPIDLAFFSKSKRKFPHEATVPSEEDLRSKHQYFQNLCGDQGLIAPGLSVKPNQSPFVIISDHYLNSVRDESIDLVEGYVESVAGSALTLSSGKIIDEPYDVLIMATGFRSDLSYLSTEIQNVIDYNPRDTHHPFLAHRLTFHPELPNAAFIGMYRGPYMGVVMLQSHWVAGVFSGKLQGPTAEELARGLSAEKALRDTFPRPQFPHSDYVGILNDLGDTLGLTPSSLWPDRNTEVVIPAQYIAGDALRSEASRLLQDVESDLAAAEKGRWVAAAVYSAWQGSWKIRRRLESANSHLPSGNFEGTASFRRRVMDMDADDPKMEYGYLEQGKLTTETGMSFDAQRRYRYHYSEESDRIDAYFDDSSDKKFFHSLRFLPPGEESAEGGVWAPWVAETRKGWCAVGEHLCAPDTYVAAYWFHFSGIHLSEWKVTYKVKGPNKDYVASARFTRP